ncbi:hypothetical protein M23134_05805 [Microscilla marina ATCC 23134]|uniref:Uncharacterized protein n=1 Tax=Microscilla marina ATCC 23134 TaxID=313606 RepID=A1ZIR4_MICM2|nr:hypothetical protein M23134_05805 [Microscilla marina ATCC 23134]
MVTIWFRFVFDCLLTLTPLFDYKVKLLLRNLFAYYFFIQKKSL